jgi:hypothetical protein
MEADRNAPGAGSKLRRRLLLVRLCRLLCGWFTQSRGLRFVSPVDHARGICAIAGLAGPRAGVAAAAAKALHLNQTD